VSWLNEGFGKFWLPTKNTVANDRLHCPIVRGKNVGSYESPYPAIAGTQDTSPEGASYSIKTNAELPPTVDVERESVSLEPGSQQPGAPGVSSRDAHMEKESNTDDILRECLHAEVLR
jgi:hypothetical protein